MIQIKHNGNLFDLRWTGKKWIDMAGHLWRERLDSRGMLLSFASPNHGESREFGLIPDNKLEQARQLLMGESHVVSYGS